MSTRKAPHESATLFKNGTIKNGNDGNKWIILTNKNGIQRWKRLSAGISTNKVTKKNKSKTKSKRILEMEADPNSIWGKNKPLEKLWESLASGKKVVLVEESGKYKMFDMPTGKMTIRKMYNIFDEDPNIVAVLSSNMSHDAYEMFLYPKAKDKSVEYVIKNYKKYFKSAGPMPKDLIEKGAPEQKKVLLPA
jgi:hypothetical protein